MFVDVIVKYKGEAESNIATIGRESSYLSDVVQRIVDDPKLEYMKLEMSSYWKSKREEKANV